MAKYFRPKKVINLEDVVGEEFKDCALIFRALTQKEYSELMSLGQDLQIQVSYEKQKEIFDKMLEMVKPLYLQGTTLDEDQKIVELPAEDFAEAFDMTTWITVFRFLA